MVWNEMRLADEWADGLRVRVRFGIPRVYLRCIEYRLEGLGNISTKNLFLGPPSKMCYMFISF